MLRKYLLAVLSLLMVASFTGNAYAYLFTPTPDETAYTCDNTVFMFEDTITPSYPDDDLDQWSLVKDKKTADQLIQDCLKNTTNQGVTRGDCEKLTKMATSVLTWINVEAVCLATSENDLTNEETKNCNVIRKATENLTAKLGIPEFNITKDKLDRMVDGDLSSNPYYLPKIEKEKCEGEDRDFFKANFNDDLEQCDALGSESRAIKYLEHGGYPILDIQWEPCSGDPDYRVTYNSTVFKGLLYTAMMKHHLNMKVKYKDYWDTACVVHNEDELKEAYELASGKPLYAKYYSYDFNAMATGGQGLDDSEKALLGVSGAFAALGGFMGGWTGGSIAGGVMGTFFNFPVVYYVVALVKLFSGDIEEDVANDLHVKTLTDRSFSDHICAVGAEAGGAEYKFYGKFEPVTSNTNTPAQDVVFETAKQKCGNFLNDKIINGQFAAEKVTLEKLKSLDEKTYCEIEKNSSFAWIVKEYTTTIDDVFRDAEEVKKEIRLNNDIALTKPFKPGILPKMLPFVRDGKEPVYQIKITSNGERRKIDNATIMPFSLDIPFVRRTYNIIDNVTFASNSTGDLNGIVVNTKIERGNGKIQYLFSAPDLKGWDKLYFHNLGNDDIMGAEVHYKDKKLPYPYKLIKFLRRFCLPKTELELTTGESGYLVEMEHLAFEDIDGKRCDGDIENVQDFIVDPPGDRPPSKIEKGIVITLPSDIDLGDGDTFDIVFYTSFKRLPIAELDEVKYIENNDQFALEYEEHEKETASENIYDVEAMALSMINDRKDGYNCKALYCNETDTKCMDECETANACEYSKDLLVYGTKDRLVKDTQIYKTLCSDIDKKYLPKSKGGVEPLLENAGPDGNCPKYFKPTAGVCVFDANKCKEDKLWANVTNETCDPKIDCGKGTTLNKETNKCECTKKGDKDWQLNPDGLTCSKISKPDGGKNTPGGDKCNDEGMILEGDDCMCNLEEGWVIDSASLSVGNFRCIKIKTDKPPPEQGPPETPEGPEVITRAGGGCAGSIAGGGLPQDIGSILPYLLLLVAIRGRIKLGERGSGFASPSKRGLGGNGGSSSRSFPPSI